MKTAFCLCMSALALLLSSCVTSTLTAAAAAGTGMAGLSSLLGLNAPEASELVGHTLTYQGVVRGADNASVSDFGTIMFGADNPTLGTTADGAVTSTFYSRQGDKQALVTMTAPQVVETYRLTFTSGSKGSYSYEKRCGADVTVGEGTFTIK